MESRLLHLFFLVGVSLFFGMVIAYVWGFTPALVIVSPLHLELGASWRMAMIRGTSPNQIAFLIAELLGVIGLTFLRWWRSKNIVQVGVALLIFALHPGVLLPLPLATLHWNSLFYAYNLSVSSVALATGGLLSLLAWKRSHAIDRFLAVLCVVLTALSVAFPISGLRGAATFLSLWFVAHMLQRIKSWFWRPFLVGFVVAEFVLRLFFLSAGLL